jgi:hypothetical protein
MSESLLSRCVEHKWCDDPNKFKWIDTKTELRAHLETKVDRIIEKFDVLSSRCVDS